MGSETIKKNVPIALIALIVAAGATCRQGRQEWQGREPRRAVLIVLDAARPDRFSCYGYGKPTMPEIDRLAERGVLFLNCYTQGTTTQTALPCLIYSRYFAPPVFPNHHSIPYASPGDLFRRLDAEAVSLPRALGETGFETAAVVAHEWITEGSAFGREFGELYNLHDIIEFEAKYAYPKADRVVDFALKWIEGRKDRDFFLYLHIMDTHFPHHFEEDAKRFFGTPEYKEVAEKFAPWGMPLDAGAEFGARDIEYLNALYDGGLRYADREVGRLLRTLKREGLLGTMVVAVTADHGEFLLERKAAISHGGWWYEPVAKIPLIIHAPGRVKERRKVEMGRRVDRVCGIVDLAPTILGLLDVKLPEGKVMDGVDLFREEEKEIGVRLQLRDRSQSPIFLPGDSSFIGMGCAGIRAGTYKCLFASSLDSIFQDDDDDDDSGAGSPPARNYVAGNIAAELYDLAEDQAERNDLAAARPEVVKELTRVYREKMRPLYERYAGARTKEPPEEAFAVSATDFGCDREAAMVLDTEDPARLKERAAAAGGWLRRSAWDNSWLFWGDGSRTVPIGISFPLPDGKYAVTADINGTCEIEAGGARKVLRSREFVEDLRWKTDPVDSGVVEVKREVFRAVIRPVFDGDKDRRGAGMTWFAIRLLGFEPVGGDPEAWRKKKEKQERARREREERLRSLGYIR